MAFRPNTSSGAGDVAGPASATDNAIARFNLTTGKLIQDSSFFTSDDNGLTALTSTITADNQTGFAVAAVSGGDFANITAEKLTITSGGMLNASDFAFGQQIFLNGHANDAANSYLIGQTIINANATGSAGSMFGQFIDLSGMLGAAPTSTGSITGSSIQVKSSVASGAIGGWSVELTNDTAACSTLIGGTINVIANIAGVTAAYGLEVKSSGSQAINALYHAQGTATVGLDLSGSTCTTDIALSGGIITHAAGDIQLTTSGSGDVQLLPVNDVVLSDGNKAASSYASELILSDTSAEWSAFETAFGEVSLLNAVKAASTTATSFTRTVVLKVLADDTALTTGDGKMHFTIPIEFTGMNLVSVGAHVYTASSSGLPSIMIHNLTDASDMLSTAITIDAGEKDSSTATTPAVINAAADDVVTADEIRIDVDGAGTDVLGLEVRLGFQTA